VSGFFVKWGRKKRIKKRKGGKKKKGKSYTHCKNQAFKVLFNAKGDKGGGGWGGGEAKKKPRWAHRRGSVSFLGRKKKRKQGERSTGLLGSTLNLNVLTKKRGRKKGKRSRCIAGLSLPQKNGKKKKKKKGKGEKESPGGGGKGGGGGKEGELGSPGPALFP